jgi:hypothetical protein
MTFGRAARNQKATTSSSNCRFGGLLLRWLELRSEEELDEPATKALGTFSVEQIAVANDSY